MINFFDFFGSGNKKKNDKYDDYDSIKSNIDRYLDGLEPIKENDYAFDFEKPDLGETPKFDRIEEDQRTEDELKQLAEDELADYLNEGLKGIDNNIAQEKSKLNDNLKNDLTTYENNKKIIDNNFDDLSKKTNNDVLKRGLARSSIAVNKINDVETSRTNEKNALDKNYNEAVKNINNAIAGLESEREKAISDFNLSYVVKLTNKLNDLKKQKEEYNLEALKYNNQMAEKEKEAALEQKKAQSDIYNDNLNSYQKEYNLREEMRNAEVKKRDQELYNYFYSELKKVDPKVAKEKIKNDPIFRKNLSNNAYMKLLYAFS